ncbi:MAG: hypothetical protein U0790_17785 [Isosphaeraceae bacterium]
MRATITHGDAMRDRADFLLRLLTDDELWFFFELLTDLASLEEPESQTDHDEAEDHVH